MRGNKTLKAVQRSSSSSYGQKEFCVQFDRECDIPPDSTRHTHACTTEDVRAMITIIQQTKPFVFTAGRKLLSFPQVSKSPLDKLNVSLLHSWLSNHKHKLFNGEFELNEESAEEEGVEDSGDEMMIALKRMSDLYEIDYRECYMKSCLSSLVLSSSFLDLVVQKKNDN